MTREERCRTLCAGDPCEHAICYMGRVRECELIHNCHGRPCATAYETALRDPARRCPRVDGDAWSIAEKPPAAALNPDNAAGQRAAACLACEHHGRDGRRWTCAAMESRFVGPLILSSDGRCPDERWPA